MLSLPETPAPNGATPALVDRGGVLRGASALRVNRLGSHYRIEVTYPPLNDASLARVFVSRLIRAKREGLRLPYPLLDVDQSACGTAVVVDGAGQTGGALRVRGLPAGVTVHEGYWLSVQSTSGQHYLHNAGGSVVADGDGKATIAVGDTMLRRAFADGARVHLAKPMIEGLIGGSEWVWGLSVDHNTAIAFTIEEAA